MLFESGCGTRRNLPAALQCYKQATSTGEGSAKASARAGALLYRGCGTDFPRDLSGAMEYYHDAAIRGNVVAANALGILLLRHGSPDAATAAFNGNQYGPRSPSSVGAGQQRRRLQQPVGGEDVCEVALYWLGAAMQKGSTDARRNLETLATRGVVPASAFSGSSAGPTTTTNTQAATQTTSRGAAAILSGRVYSPHIEAVPLLQRSVGRAPDHLNAHLMAPPTLRATPPLVEADEGGGSAGGGDSGGVAGGHIKPRASEEPLTSPSPQPAKKLNSSFDEVAAPQNKPPRTSGLEGGSTGGDASPTLLSSGEGQGMFVSPSHVEKTAAGAKGAKGGAPSSSSLTSLTSLTRGHVRSGVINTVGVIESTQPQDEEQARRWEGKMAECKQQQDGKAEPSSVGGGGLASILAGMESAIAELKNTQSATKAPPPHPVVGVGSDRGDESGGGAGGDRGAETYTDQVAKATALQDLLHKKMAERTATLLAASQAVTGDDDENDGYNEGEKDGDRDTDEVTDRCAEAPKAPENGETKGREHRHVVLHSGHSEGSETQVTHAVVSLAEPLAVATDVIAGTAQVEFDEMGREERRGGVEQAVDPSGVLPPMAAQTSAQTTKKKKTRRPLPTPKIAQTPSVGGTGGGHVDLHKTSTKKTRRPLPTPKAAETTVEKKKRRPLPTPVRARIDISAVVEGEDAKTQECVKVGGKLENANMWKIDRDREDG